MARLELQVEVSGQPKDLDVLTGALAPELGEELPGTRVQLDRTSSGTVSLTIEGDRPAPVRAAANAYLGWAKTVEDVLDVTPRSSKE